MLLDCQSVLGDRKAAVCRELTKKFEEIRRGTLEELAVGMKEKPVKGEIVVVIDRVGQSTVNPSDLEADLRDALKPDDRARCLGCRGGGTWVAASQSLSIGAWIGS